MEKKVEGEEVEVGGGGGAVSKLIKNPRQGQ